jgi:uncharacterized membrane protein
MTVQTILTVVALLAMSGLFHIVPRLTRPDLFFAVTVASDFRRTAEARRILSRFYAIVSGCTLLAIALEALARLPLAAMLVQGGGFIWALVEAHARALSFAAPSNPIVEVDLAAPRERLPGGPLVAILPLVALAALGVWTGFHMDRLPPRFAVHFGLHGPDRWVDTTPATVFAFLAIFASVCLLLIGVAWALLHWSRRISTSGAGADGERRFRRRVVLLLIVTEYLMLFPACAMLFQPGAAAMNVWGVALTIVIVGFVATLLHAGQGGSRKTVAAGAAPIGDRTPDACWKWGLFYVNPADPSILIESRFGIGYTVNLGNRWTWIVLSLLLVPIVICTMVLR